MHLSVILPIYGVEKYIEKNLISLFSQTKTDGVEFILVNDCTRDTSMQIARRVISKYTHLDIKIVEHEVNKGLPSARQSGLDIATGDYILHIDSDDWCELNMLEDMYSCAINNSADIVVCDYYIAYPNKEIYCNQYVTNKNGIRCLEDMYKRNFNYGVWNKLVKRLFSKYQRPSFKTLIKALNILAVGTQQLICYDKTKGQLGVIRSGSNWVSITDGVVRYIIKQMKSDIKHYRHGSCVDETYKASILYNSPFWANVLMMNRLIQLRSI